MFAKRLAIAENFRDALNHGYHLAPLHKGVESHPQVRIGRQPSPNAQRKTNLGTVPCLTTDRGQTYIVDLRIRAPDAASRDRNLEFAWKIVKIGIPD